MNDAEYRRQEAEKNRAYKAKMDAHNREVRERDQRRAEEARKMSSGGQSSCFSAGTKVTTPEGPRCIESLMVGDTVSAFCESTREFVQRPVRRHAAHSAARIWQITISGAAAPIATTGTHLFLTRRGWRRAKRLRIGDELYTRVGWQSIETVKKTERVEPVYNLVVEEALTFVADGVVVHSFAHFRALRSCLHRVILGVNRVGSKKPATLSSSASAAVSSDGR
jgi:Pretoxin HINT domain